VWWLSVLLRIGFRSGRRLIRPQPEAQVYKIWHRQYRRTRALACLVEPIHTKPDAVPETDPIRRRLPLSLLLLGGIDIGVQGCRFRIGRFEVRN
jgi:hypothetical protein